MNKEEKTKQLIKEIENSWGYWGLKSGSLYFFLFIWHFFTYTSVKSCIYLARIYIYGYENRSEELGMKDYVRSMGKLKLLFMIFCISMFNFGFCFGKQTRSIYMETGCLFLFLVALVNLRKINIIKMIVGKAC